MRSRWPYSWQPAAAPSRQTADTYLSGQVLLRIVFVGEGGGSRVEDVTFFADGKQVCVTPGAKAECSWDAGNEVTSHALRAVARLKAGGRVVSAIRTKAIEYAESVSVDANLQPKQDYDLLRR